MQNCQTASAGNTPLVPNKRVNYAFGMVLGADDFQQEQLNTQWKFHMDARLPHGYGTLCGLQITVETLPDGSDVQIRIGPGYAISPQGHWLWVQGDLCALLNAWLTANPGGLSAGPQSVYVRLCCTECLTDLVPIAANACASAADSTAPSRITETAAADFSWTAPQQIAEERVREFGRLLSEVEIVSEVLSPDDSAFFLEQVSSLGALTSPSGSPVVSPALLSPPQGVIRLSSATACATFQAALTIWATEVRPTLNGSANCCLPVAADEDCLLLARIDFTMNAQGQLQVQQPVTLVQDDRPILADTRLLQEWITCGPQSGTAAQEQSFATVMATNSPNNNSIVEVWVHYPSPLTFPSGSVSVQINGVSIDNAILSISAVGRPSDNAFVIEIDGTNSMGALVTVSFDTRLIYESADPTQTLWSVLETPSVNYTNRSGNTLLTYCIFGASHNDLFGLKLDNHPQYLLVDPTNRSLITELNAANNKITGLQAATNASDAVRFDQAVQIAKDIGGTYAEPLVVGLQGQSVSSNKPTAAGQVLTWSAVGAGQWQAQPVIDIFQIARTLPTLPFATITPMRGAGQFSVWFHLNAGTGTNGQNNEELQHLTPAMVQVFEEAGAVGAAAGPYLTTLNASISQIQRNVWQITVTSPDKTTLGRLLRFVFTLDQMFLLDGKTTLAAFAAKRPMLWEGCGGDVTVAADGTVTGGTVTVFVQNGTLTRQ